MTIKRILLIVPLVLGLLLAQSYLWVPTYESQTTGNPKRLSKFIEASIGDAKILNPILHSDTASGRIVDMVFDGLLDLDEDLNLRARLATEWHVTETVYLLPNPDVRLPNGVSAEADHVFALLNVAFTSAEFSDLRASLTGIDIVNSEHRTEEIRWETDGRDGAQSVTLRVPRRIRLVFDRVQQDIAARLRPVLGGEYFRVPSYMGWTTKTTGITADVIQSHLAEVFPVVEHNPTIVFNLRRGVTFHDGHEFDAGDVKFTYEAILDPKNLSPRTSDFEPIKAVNITNKYEVEVVYKRLFSPAVNAWTIGILPEHLLDTQAQEIERRTLSVTARDTFGLREMGFNRAPIGTGPFVFVAWQSDELIHLRANYDYWDGPPQFKDYYYRVLPDPLTQEVEFRTGAIDIYSPQPNQIVRYKDDSAYQSFSTLSTGYTYIGYNQRRPLFTDQRVRRALAMAINTDDIINYVMYGEGEKTTGPYPKNTPWYDHSVSAVDYDPEGSLRLLREAGWRRNAEGWLEKDGKVLEFNLITNHGNLVRKAVMTIAQNAWQKIGIKCNTQVFEWAVFLKDFINPGNFDAVILGWRMGVDPDLYQIFHSSQSEFAQLNFVRYANPEADALIEMIRREYDPLRQQDLTHRLHRVIAMDQPYTFLYAPLATTVLDNKIVMHESSGEYVRIPATKSGNVFFHFNRWTKLEHALAL